MDSIIMNKRNHIVVVAAIIVRDGRIFATQRGYGSGRIGGSSREEKKTKKSFCGQSWAKFNPFKLQVHAGHTYYPQHQFRLRPCEPLVEYINSLKCNFL